MRTGDQVVQELPWRWGVQGKIFVIGGLGYMFDAYDVVLVGFLIPLLAESPWDLSRAELGLFGTVGLAGMAVGALSWGTIADSIGRKKAFTYTVLIYAVFSVLAAAAPSYELLLLARFITGIGLGGCIPVDFSMVAEFSPRKVRGRVLTVLDVWWPIGATLCGLISAALLTFQSWRVLLLVMVLPALLVFWIRHDVPESPLYLVRKGREAEAREVITGLIDRTGADTETWQMPAPESTSERVDVRRFILQFRDVWRYNWRFTLAAWGLFVSVIMLYFGVLTWLPSILVEQGYSTYAAFLLTSLLTAAGVAGILVAAWLVEVVGRKLVIVAGGVVSSAAMVFFALQLDISAAARLWLLVFGFAIEFIISAMYCFVPELYPTLLRASGFGWASTASRVGAGLVPVLFGVWMWPVLGLTYTFLIIGLFVSAAVLWTLLVAPETKGKDLDAVRAETPRLSRQGETDPSGRGVAG